MSLSLAGRHALVCGASEGIGRAAAIALADLGATVTLLARRADRLAQVCDALPAPAGQTHGALAVDVTDGARLREQVAGLAAAQPVHILVNNTAGPPAARRTWRTRPVTWRCSSST